MVKFFYLKIIYVIIENNLTLEQCVIYSTPNLNKIKFPMLFNIQN